MTGATHGAGTDYPSGAPDFIQGFQYGFVLLSLNFLCNICHPLFALSYFFQSLHCLSLASDCHSGKLFLNKININKKKRLTSLVCNSVSMGCSNTILVFFSNASYASKYCLCLKCFKQSLIASFSRN